MISILQPILLLFISKQKSDWLTQYDLHIMPGMLYASILMDFFFTVLGASLEDHLL